MASTTDQRALWCALAVCAAFLVGVFMFVSLGPDPLDHGDRHTDTRAIIAAHQFRRVGVNALHFLQVEDGGAEIGLEPPYYPRHPAIGAAGLAFLQRAGLSLGVCRLLPLLVSTLGVFCFFLFFRAVTGNAWIGVLAAAVYASLAPIWLLADSFLLHGWSLAAKAVALWLIAAGCLASARARWLRFGAAGLVAAGCIILCGLETMPSTGFLAFLLPLVLVDGPARVRIIAAFQCAASVGLGMIAGLGVRFWNMAQAWGGSLEAAWVNFSGSLKFRSSLGPDEVVLALGRPYPVELVWRLWIYMPHVFVLFALALIATFVVRARTGRWPRWLAGGVVVAALVGEGLYFVGMRNHAQHHHTLMLLTLTMTAVATSSLALLGGLLPRSFPAVWRGVVAAAILVVSSFFAPLVRGGLGNVRAPMAPTGPDTLREVLDEVAAQARLLPRESVVIVSTPWRFDFGVPLALQDHTMVVLGPPLEGRDWPRVLQHGRDSGRPLFAMLHREGLAPETLSDVASVGRPVVAGKWVSLYALAHFDPAALPILRTTMPDEVLKDTVFIAPTAAELAAAGIVYKVFGGATVGVWMSVPRDDIKARATIGVVPFRPDPGFSAISSATAVFAYGRVPGVAQPPIVLGFRVRTARGAAESRGDLSVERTVMPGETVECRISIPAGIEVSEFEISARRPDGERSSQSAAVNCTEIRFEHR